MKLFSLLFTAFLLSHFGFSQIKELNPTSIKTLDLSVEGEKEFKETSEMASKAYAKLSKGVKKEELSKEERDALSNVNPVLEDYWDIIGGGCSWYCGGGPKEVTGSSFLKAQGVNNYEPINAHDLSYKNAWAEGVEGYGIGEYLLYTFEGKSPRITEINVVNGYVKSQASWENNSRVKRLKMYIDNVPYAILNLKDICGIQSFKIEPLGNSDRKDWDKLVKKPDWTIKFEILDVYKGLKYDDVVITEIYFDGIDVHCLAKGTKIQLSGSKFKNIEDLKVGDLIVTFDYKNNRTTIATISKTESVKHSELVKYCFESGLELTATQDHPLLNANNSWCSLKPEKSKIYKGFNNIVQIKINDVFLVVDTNGQLKKEKLVKIEYLTGVQETFTISKLSNGDNFIANGLIVGIEEINN